jgi:glycosyltransferase involved in cell wall biosynthesis
MRIAHVIHSANPAGGGPIEGVRQLSSVTTRLGNDVEVICLDAPDAPWLKDFPLPVHAMGPSYLGYGFSQRLIPWLRDHASDYDAFVVNGIWQYNSLATRWALRKSGKPYCVFTHGMLDPWFKKRYPLKHLKKWLYWPWAEYRVLRDAAAVLFTCEEERIQARRSFWLYRCNEKVVGYGIAGPSGDEAAQRRTVTEKFPELSGKRIFLFLGRIQEKKGCDLLIRAFAKTAAADDSIRLVFAGPDQTGWVNELRALADSLGIGGRIVWTGMIAGDLKWGMLRAAEVFILPSHQENFGIAVAEALACGTPVLISNKVNIWREIQEDRAGFVDEDNEPGTVRLLAKWLGMSAQEREAMKSSALGSFQSRFEVERAGEAFLRVLETVAAKV